MADGEDEQPQDGEHEETPDEGETPPKAEFRMELRDSLPGDRAVIAVESEGEFMWLASREHVSPKAVDEFVDTLRRVVEEGMWVQNWTGQ